jgi:hypothetical protein
MGRGKENDKVFMQAKYWLRHSHINVKDLLR